MRRSGLLALAEYHEHGLSLAERERLTPRLVALNRDDPDPGVHSAAGWLLDRWGQQKLLAEATRSFSRGEPAGNESGAGISPRGARRWSSFRPASSGAARETGEKRSRLTTGSPSPHAK